MSFKFTEVQKDDLFEELEQELGFVSRVLAQYHVNSEISLETYDFKDKDNYRSFFEQFGESENSEWKIKTDCDWDFGKFPYRESSDTTRGLVRILKTGGAYDEENGALHEDKEAIDLENTYLEGFRKKASELYIFDVIMEDIRGEILELKHISLYFELLAWDDLIFIINPAYSTLYVIAYTDTD
ncbi:MAG: hypothetical protein ACTSV2_10385 [Candidatus Thorarchaeota archaeon]